MGFMGVQAGVIEALEFRLVTSWTIWLMKKNKAFFLKIQDFAIELNN